MTDPAAVTFRYTRRSMGKRDSRVDEYIEASEEFARPILRHLRDVVHAASPAIEETMKWGFPHFMYQGMLCSMASFKRHCAFGFWKERLVLAGETERKAEAMGQFGRITSLRDLPPDDVLRGYLERALELNEKGVKSPRREAGVEMTEADLPDAFRAALEQHPGAAATFERFSPSARREYVEWIAEARREDTRARRIATAVEWLAEGKPRNWKYTSRG
jgi:uncharacterized protein YdeI (YjbR/CyaY-like superfamily)